MQLPALQYSLRPPENIWPLAGCTPLSEQRDSPAGHSLAYPTSDTNVASATEGRKETPRQEYLYVALCRTTPGATFIHSHHILRETPIAMSASVGLGHGLVKFGQYEQPK